MSDLLSPGVISGDGIADSLQRLRAARIPDPEAVAPIRTRRAVREGGGAAGYIAAAYTAAQGHLPGVEMPDGDAGAGKRVRLALGGKAAVAAIVALLLLAAGLLAVGIVRRPAVEAEGEVQLIDTNSRLDAVAGGGDEEGAEAGEGAQPDASGVAATDGPASAPQVVVYVVGQVVTPQLVTLPLGSRVGDAIGAAGGATPEADLAAINLARVLVDGEQLKVPLPGEVVAEPPPAVVATGGTAPTGKTANGLINLNTADAATLQTLPGIGPALAGRIIDWREAHGSFARVTELTEVSGIGPAIMSAVQDLVTV